MIVSATASKLTRQISLLAQNLSVLNMFCALYLTKIYGILLFVFACRQFLMILLLLVMIIIQSVPEQMENFLIGEY